MIVQNVHAVVNRANLAYADVILGAESKGRIQESGINTKFAFYLQRHHISLLFYLDDVFLFVIVGRDDVYQ